MLLKFIKRTALAYLDRRGFDLVPKNGQNRLSLDSAIKRRHDVEVKSIIDVGASDGRWSERMLKHYPQARYLLVEAQEAAHGDGLRRFKATHANVHYALCAAGDRDGEIYFNAEDPWGGQASTTPFPHRNIVVPMATLDTLVRQHQLERPYLLKLDTHGFEVPILSGAKETLQQASMLIIEAYNYTLCPGSLRFYELCTYLEVCGFRCADWFEPIHRPGDGALWQMDIVFLPVTHAIFKSNEYRPPASASDAAVPDKPGRPPYRDYTEKS
jgi:FkbM family methyltransferase